MSTGSRNNRWLSEIDIMPFDPAPWAPGGDLQTILGYLLPCPLSLPQKYERITRLDDKNALLLIENTPQRWEAESPVVLLVHGLGGSSDSPYVRRTAWRCIQNGWIAVRMNQRGAGRGSRLAQGLYNAGSSADLAAVVNELVKLRPNSPLVVIGFSLGGNVLLKYLGEAQHQKPSALRGGIAVCPPIDLIACTTHLSRSRFGAYSHKFVALMRMEARTKPGLKVDRKALTYWRPMSLMNYDERVTAPAGGYESVQDYYDKCSGQNFLESIETPTLILAADDDPIVPSYTHDNLKRSQTVQIIRTRGGGHVGYLSRQQTPNGDHRWLDYALVEYSRAIISSTA